MVKKRSGYLVISRSHLNTHKGMGWFFYRNFKYLPPYFWSWHGQFITTSFLNYSQNSGDGIPFCKGILRDGNVFLKIPVIIFEHMKWFFGFMNSVFGYCKFCLKLFNVELWCHYSIEPVTTVDSQVVNLWLAGGVPRKESRTTGNVGGV